MLLQVPSDVIAPVFAAWLIFVVLLTFGFAWLLQYLWNTTMPQLFALKPTTYWQSFRLYWIALLLFSGFGLALRLR